MSRQLSFFSALLFLLLMSALPAYATGAADKATALDGVWAISAADAKDNTFFQGTPLNGGGVLLEINTEESVLTMRFSDGESFTRTFTIKSQKDNSFVLQTKGGEPTFDVDGDKLTMTVDGVEAVLVKKESK